MGGFGNQIFQYCKAKDFENLGFKTTIDTTNYEKFKGKNMYPNIHREQVFPIDYFGFKETPSYLKLIHNNLQKINRLHLLPSSLNPSKEINDHNIFEEKFKKYNVAIGYWQDASLVKKHKEFVIKSLSKNKILLNSFNSKATTGSTLLHVRRGDYVNLKENLNDNFYQKALNYCKNNIINFNYQVFTDDYEWVKSNKLFKDATYIHSDNISIENTIESFGKMLINENFIVGNSTFPLIASILSEKENSKVLVANPWFLNKNRNLNFPENWIKVDR